MGLKDALDISVDGITANRIAMEIIASNLANINTTRTVQGGPYKRKIAVFEEKPLEFSEVLNNAQKIAGGVQVAQIQDDPSPFQMVFNPGHPDADPNGYVKLPNVSMAREMVDMVEVQKLYQANIVAYNASKKMAQDTLQIQ
jgi:flagellar basal-body rod protein FlgC